MKNIKRFIKYLKITDSNCWEWQGAIDKDGYGFYTLNKLMSAHRASYIMFVGKISKGKQIDHLCRNRSCVNPDHLEQVSPRENTLRSPIAPAAINSRKTHCYKGHEFRDENLYIVKTTGERRCRTCTNLNKKARRSKLDKPRKPDRTYCKYAHLLDDTNMGFSKSGEWYCKKCVADRQKKYKANKRRVIAKHILI